MIKEKDIIKILHEWRERWLLCWNGEKEDSAFDCACCLDNSESEGCLCICHKREKELAKLFCKSLLALSGTQKEI